MIKAIENRNYDVAVVGGGFGGISAALAAARGGKRVVLFERQYMVGGLATAGLITVYLPLCDGFGHQVSFGIAEELFRLSVKHGYDCRYPANWLDGVGTRTEKDSRFLVQFNPQLFAILAERLLLEAGVDIMYGSFVADAAVKDGRIEYISVENKSGRTNYYIKSVVDASGDFDIGVFAGAKYESYAPGNLLAAWYYYTDENGYHAKQFGAADSAYQDEELVTNRFGGIDAEEVSKMVCVSHEKILDDYLKRQGEGESIALSTIATIPQLRMTRKIVGEYELKYDEEHTAFEDSIGMVSSWLKRGPVWEVPYRTLYSKEIKNLITAGRITSVDEKLWNIMRVIPCCAVTGEAAGTAAALTDDFSTLDVKELQKKLTQNGVKLHLGEVLN